MQELLRLPQVTAEAVGQCQQALQAEHSQKDRRTIVKKFLGQSGTSHVCQSGPWTLQPIVSFLLLTMPQPKNLVLVAPLFLMESRLEPHCCGSYSKALWKLQQSPGQAGGLGGMLWFG